MTYSNLRKMIDNGVNGLSDEDAMDVMNALCSGCRQRTKDRIRSILRYGLQTVDNCGILERVQYDEKDGWYYVAGQDCTAERKVVRDIILGR